MCNKISSDIVLGNFFIEAFEKEIDAVDLNLIIKFEELLNNKLDEDGLNCYAYILVDEIYNLVNTYSSFLEINQGVITLNIARTERETIIDKLIYFFREGLPSFVKNIFSTISNEVLV